PGLRAEHARAAADGHGVVLVTVLVRADHPLRPVGVDKHARVALKVGAGVVAITAEAVVAQVVARNVVIGQVAPALDQQYAFAGPGKPAGSPPPAGACPDDNCVISGHARTSKPIMRQETPSRLPPLPGSL